MAAWMGLLWWLAAADPTPLSAHELQSDEPPARLMVGLQQHDQAGPLVGNLTMRALPAAVAEQSQATATNYSWQAVQMLAALLLVILLIRPCLALLQRYVPWLQTSSQSRYLKLKDRLMLGPRQFIALIEVDKHTTVMVGISENTMAKLASWPMPQSAAFDDVLAHTQAQTTTKPPSYSDE